MSNKFTIKGSNGAQITGLAYDAGFSEADHPRADNGQFGAASASHAAKNKEHTGKAMEAQKSGNSTKKISGPFDKEVKMGVAPGKKDLYSPHMEAAGHHADASVHYANAAAHEKKGNMDVANKHGARGAASAAKAEAAEKAIAGLLAAK